MSDELVVRGDEVAPAVDPEALPMPVKDAFMPGATTAPVAAQRASHVNAAKLESEKLVVAAPLSYAGSAARIWKLTGVTTNPAGRVGLALVALALIACAWSIVTCWYVVFGVLLVPYRLIRRGSRKRKREALQHREMLAALQERNS
jgi:hypothetical protein